jgi:type III restriction enzyme
LLGGYDVRPLLDCSASEVGDANRGLVLIATAAKFAREETKGGDRKIFRVSLDKADQPLWDLLKARRDAEGRRRPLLVVYDEGHNLSDLQTRRLLELEPDALIAASATMRVPSELENTIDRLRHDKNWQDSDFVTAVPSSKIVAAGLIKKHIMLGGYVTPMETAVSDLLAGMRLTEEEAKKLGLGLRPKAIYVSTTNTVDGVPTRSDVRRPFKERMARPILIWRHLVEKEQISAADIAVYCNLEFDTEYPPPGGFNLFAGGDTDYDRFISGKYRHIIFNLSLQEGWDDPEVYCAYIDKEMGSADQVTQVIGRVLRQPGAQHYTSVLS